jgi:hypothetical protein
MATLFGKLNFKDQSCLYLENAPPSFLPLLAEIPEGVPVHHQALSKTKSAPFVLAFATQQKEVDQLARRLAKSTSGDAVIWIAYPKGTSKKFKCDFNRDTGWTQLGVHGFEPVRQVAIDEDWSALRFRRVEFIKKMTRSFAMTAAGKEKVKKSK